jgi:hypothetical protein
MGYYIQTPMRLQKVGYLKNHYGAVEIPRPNCSSLVVIVPEGQGLVCVIENVMFDAAGYIYDDNELRRALPTATDKRKRTWLVFNKEKIEYLSGFIKDEAIFNQMGLK